MTDFFALESIRSKLHIQFTGEVLNMHIDKLYDLDADPNNVIRVMVMLQDWEPGQFIMYGNQQYDRWERGDTWFDLGSDSGILDHHTNRKICWVGWSCWEVAWHRESTVNQSTVSQSTVNRQKR